MFQRFIMVMTVLSMGCEPDPDPGTDYLFLAGDSMCASWELAAPGMWEAGFPDLGLANKCIWGFTTLDLRLMIEYLDYSHLTPKIIILNIGVNDIIKETGDLSSHLKPAVEKLQADMPGVPVLLVSPHTTLKLSYNWANHVEMEIIARADENVYFLNLQPAFDNHEDWWAIHGDGVHFNEAGYEFYLGLIQGKINELKLN